MLILKGCRRSPFSSHAFGVHLSRAQSTIRSSVDGNLSPSLVEKKLPSVKPVPSQGPFSFEISVQVIPHPEKVSFGGEDAFFVLDPLSFGVADGVGGWREGGINPAEYARQIMQVTSDQLTQGSDLLTALESAHSVTRLPGSCTACIVKLDETNGELSALNLGDSGFVVIRDNAILGRSTSQQHYFDCPRQLAACPEYCQSTDTPKDGETKTLSLQDGDLIIMGTDGLWDNVFDEQILNYTPEKYGKRKTVSDLSEGLARLAQRNALDKELSSPYSIAALAEGYDVSPFEKIFKAKFSDGKFTLGTLTGGKLDDITVIVAKLRRQS